MLKKGRSQTQRQYVRELEARSTREKRWDSTQGVPTSPGVKMWQRVCSAGSHHDIHARARWDAHQHVLPFVYTRRGVPVERIRCRFLPMLTCKITYPLLFFGTSWLAGDRAWADLSPYARIHPSESPSFRRLLLWWKWDGQILTKKVTILRQSRPRLCSCEATNRYNMAEKVISFQGKKQLPCWTA